MIENCDGHYTDMERVNACDIWLPQNRLRAHCFNSDDDKSKHGSGYRNIDVKISHPELEEVPEQSNFLITSLESVRPIAKRVLDFTPKRIFVPGVY